MTTDLELFMLWNNGRKLEEQIIEDIQKQYEIIAKNILPPIWHVFMAKTCAKAAKKSKKAARDLFC